MTWHWPSCMKKWNTKPGSPSTWPRVRRATSAAAPRGPRGGCWILVVGCWPDAGIQHPHENNPLKGAFHHFKYDVKSGRNYFPQNVYPKDCPMLQEQLKPLKTYPVEVRDIEVWVGASRWLSHPGLRQLAEHFQRAVRHPGDIVVLTHAFR